MHLPRNCISLALKQELGGACTAPVNKVAGAAGRGGIPVQTQRACALQLRLALVRCVLARVHARLFRQRRQVVQRYAPVPVTAWRSTGLSTLRPPPCRGWAPEAAEV